MSAPALLLALSGIAAGCWGGDDDDPEIGCSGGVIDVTVTLPMFAEFACSVGSGNVNVGALLPLEGDPHSYVPPESDSELISGAKLVLYAGLGLDEPLREYIFTHGRGSAQLINYAASLRSPTAEQPPQDQPEIDAQEAGDNPYLWLDPAIARGYVDATRDSLEIVDPEHISDYQAAYDAYAQRIAELQVEMTQDLEAIPAQNRNLVTLHDSMVHFGRAFGFGIVGHLTEPGETPDEAAIADLADAVREAGVPAVFTEAGYDASLMQRVADAAGVELCTLYTDRADSGAHTYEEMMRVNVDELVRCLGG
ncbi:MAG TPA: metal ABC transporter substrate-binding protein [Dehalococcoidia bacterium]|nr:metal ABC transporter substrate-binding protein [Dehalococcoidia bacterium]